MSAPTARRLVTAGSLSLALALASPVAAFADHKDDHDGRGSDGGAQPSASPSPAAQGGSSTGAQGGQGSSAGTGSSGSGNGSQGSQGSQGGKGSQDAKGSQGGGSKGAKGSQGAKGDPRGNNGTVKIDGEPFDDGRGNDPHVGCVFEVDFYGFDRNDTATITFTAQAPTGAGTPLHTQSGTLISDDAAGGGQDADAELTFSVSNQLSELLSITPHPKQGWHVKLEVDVDSAPGGAKQKVFWIKCAPTAATTTTGVAGTTQAPATGGGGGGGGTTVTTAGAGGGAATVVDRRTLKSAPEVTLGSGTTTVTGTTTQAAAGAGAATVSARGSRTPSALPFTGVEGLAYLLALGASAVGVGTLAHRLGRRRATV